MTLDIPDEVRNSALADGHAAWLDGLPSVLDSLAQDWSLTIGATMRGGHGALVVEATLADGTPSVLKVAVPGRRGQLGHEATALELAAGKSCVRLIRRDLARDALLLERLGPAMHDVIVDHHAQHDLLCDLVAQLWRPLDDDIDLPTGADLAHRMRHRIPRLWEELARPCSAATIDDAVECADRRERAYHRRTSVLVHGDVHEANALQAEGATFKLIDPDGLRAEPACDLGTIVRCTPDSGDDLRVRTERLAARTGVDATAIWEWGTIHRVIGGLNGVRVGFQPFGNLLLAEADRLTRGTATAPRSAGRKPHRGG
ncbi:aminoglycoside phosphotransferase family protein [Fodinicola acaciae]|uniref:aminoglycoside phosphotransferase family protein n=1 Tax=Fodinicola acaciae TaxID=2681555 RepID=UPI0013D5FB41|nr:aminoglycoside phosphotransferase family protein [Fodinicola acaciae]